MPADTNPADGPFPFEKQLAEEILHATNVIYDLDQETPLESFDLGDGNEIQIKREDTSQVRSYKWRGAYHKLLRCVEGGDSGPFAATSAGNHAQGVALAASKLAVKATIFMPQTTPKLKQDAVERFGGENVTVKLVGDNYDEAAAASAAWVEKHQATVIPPFDDLHVIAGQATVGVELLKQAPEMSAVFVPIGGGGLASGISFVTRHTNVRVIGVEASGQDSMRHAIQARSRESLPEVDRFCDGTAVRIPGSLNFDICHRYLDSIVAVTNEQVCRAIEECWNHKRLIPEPSGALAVAGIMQAVADGTIDPANHRCAAIITGANTDFLNLPTIVRGCRMTSNSRRFFRFEISERNGSLVELLDNFIGEFNIVDFQYGKTSDSVGQPVLGLAGTEEQHDRLIKKLAENDVNAEQVTSRETIQYRVIPFRPDLISNPIFLHIDFPDRPGALRDLMHEVSEYAGICYFNYAESGTQEGQALIGFECNQRDRLVAAIEALQFPYHEMEMGSLLAD